MRIFLIFSLVIKVLYLLRIKNHTYQTERLSQDFKFQTFHHIIVYKKANLQNSKKIYKLKRFTDSNYQNYTFKIS